MKFLKMQQKSWVPPFCPNRNCLHHKSLQGEWQYKKSGFLVFPICFVRSITRFLRGEALEMRCMKNAIEIDMRPIAVEAHYEQGPLRRRCAGRYTDAP